jgi:tetratricopeptide (TPR) repeat protein
MAVEAYTAAGRIRPDDSNVREKLSRTLLGLDMRAEAIPVLEEIVRLNPMRHGIFELLGELHITQGNFEKAAEAFEKCITLNPADLNTYRNAAAIMRRIGKPERAVEILDSVKEKFLNKPEFMIDFAVSLSMAKRHLEALASMKGTINAAESTSPELRTYDLYYLAAGIAYQAKEHDQAAAYYKQAIEIDPDNAAGSYNDLGYMWLELNKNTDAAGELIKRAVEMEPDNGAYLDSFGWFFYIKGNYTEALNYLLKAANHAPPEGDLDRDEFLAVIHDHIGDAFFKLGKTSEALHHWKIAIRHKVDQPGVAEKIEKEEKRMTSNPQTQEPKPGL